MRYCGIWKCMKDSNLVMNDFQLRNFKKKLIFGNYIFKIMKVAKW